MPSGMLAMESQGYAATDRIAVAIDGPAAEAAAIMPELIARARPNCLLGNIWRNNAPFTAMMPAAPRPCAPLARASIVTLVAVKHKLEATVKTATPER